MSQIPEQDPVAKRTPSAIEQLREIRDSQFTLVVRAQEVLNTAKKELSRLDKAIKQWEPKE